MILCKVTFMLYNRNETSYMIFKDNTYNEYATMNKYFYKQDADELVSKDFSISSKYTKFRIELRALVINVHEIFEFEDVFQFKIKIKDYPEDFL